MDKRHNVGRHQGRVVPLYLRESSYLCTSLLRLLTAAYVLCAGFRPPAVMI